MDIIAFAMKMEKDGEAFYKKLANETTQKGLKVILNQLADDEATHYAIFERIKTATPELRDTQVLDTAKTVFQDMSLNIAGIDVADEQVQLYREAQKMEDASMNFYRETANTTDDAARKSLLLRLAEEEHTHLVLLENVVEFLERPRAWLENAEWSHLEEY
jgi:rubrerythrin